MNYGITEFESYRDFKELSHEELKLAVNYICGNLNSTGCFYPYWYDMYCYTSKTFIVMKMRKKNGLKELGKLGEAVCNGKIINFLNEKDHFNCQCSSVYFKAVF